VIYPGGVHSNASTEDGETHCGFAYASFPTLRDMVAYADTFQANKPQCLFELAREGTVVAPYMDIDCTLDRQDTEDCISVKAYVCGTAEQ
jgi:hypothetical protein